MYTNNDKCNNYNPFLVYCRELAPGTVSLTGDWAKGDDSQDVNTRCVYIMLEMVFYYQEKEGSGQPTHSF